MAALCQLPRLSASQIWNRARCCWPSWFGAMKGNLNKAAGLFAAPASQVARLAAALQEKKAGEESAA